MKYKNKIKAVFKAVWRVFVVLIGIALIIYLTIDIGAKPPLMANRNARNDNQMYSMQDNNNYWSTSNEYNFIGDLGFDIDTLDWQVDESINGYYDEFYLDDIDFGSQFNSSITFGIGLEVIDTTNIYASYELYIGLPFTDFSSIDDDNYYYFYSELNASGYEGDTIDGISYSITDIKFKDYFYNPILKGSFIKNNFEYLGFTIYCDLTNVDGSEYVGSYLTFSLGLFDLSGFIDLNYDNGYDNGYDSGYSDGINYAEDKFINYGSFAYLDYIQYGADLEQNEYNLYYLTENNYLNNGILQLGKLGEELGLSYSANSIFMNFNELPISYTNLLFRAYDINPGQYNIIVYYDMPENQTNSISYTTTSTNFFDLNSFIAPPNALSISEIIIEYSNLESVSSIVSNGGNYNIGYQQGEQNGYETGYGAGFETGVASGVDSILAKPNDYGLYDEQQYISYGQNQYGSGYNSGLSANGVVGLDWFKASISVVNDFLNIMILPNVTIGNIFAGMIILLILSWVLSWFRG